MIQIALVFLAGALIALAVIQPLEKLLVAMGMGRANYRGEVIPCGMGAIFVLVGGGISLVLSGFVWHRWIPLIAILCFGVLGFLDDRFGTRAVGGFKGHFRVLLKEHRMTTGALKALGGGLVALFLGWELACERPELWSNAGSFAGLALPLTFLNAGLIALSANTINLLDTRPGRAIKVWAVLLAALLVIPAILHSLIQPPFWAWLIFAVLGGTALVYSFRDFGAKSMMGDVGSNVLGATLGLALAGDLNLTGRIIALALLFGFNLFCEKYSVSQLLDRRKARSQTG